MKKYFTLFFVCISFLAQAATITWGGGTGNWDIPANWVGGALPTASDDVTINSGHVTIPNGYVAMAKSVWLTGNLGTASLTISNTASLSIQSSTGNGFTLNAGTSCTNLGELTINNAGQRGLQNYGTFQNQGDIEINSPDLYGIINAGSFTNTGSISISDSVWSGLYNNPNGAFTNGGNITINMTSSSDRDGIGNHNDFINTASGLIQITLVSSNRYGYIQSTNLGANTINNGTIEILGATGSGSNDWGIRSSGNNTTIHNQPCGKIILGNNRIRLSSGGSLINDGWIHQDCSGTNDFTSTFTNNGSIEDIQNSFASQPITNNGYLVSPLTGIFNSGTAVSPALSGNGSGITLTGNSFYTTNALTTSAGTYDAGTNTWTPNSNAVGLSIFYMEMDDGSGCPEIMEIHLSSAVAAPPGGVCASPAVVGSLPYSYSGTTQGTGDDYDETDACLSDNMGGEDMVFTYTSSGNEVIRIKLEKTGGPNGNNAPGLFFLDGCPDAGGNCLYSNTTLSTATIYLETVHIPTPGTYYIVLSSHPIFHNWFDFTLTIDQPTGNICENAQSISSLPYSNSGTTQYLGDDYDNTNTCASIHMDGNDVVFIYSAPGNQIARIKLEKTNGPNGNYGHAVFVLDGCPNAGGNCLYSATTFANEPIYIETVNLMVAGTYYIVVSSHPAFHDWFEFNLTIDLPTGNICENATSINSLPYSTSGESTCLLGDDYSSATACSTPYIDANDHVYKYTATSTGNIDISLSNLSTGGSSIHFVEYGCLGIAAATCTTQINNTASNYSFENLPVTAGSEYYIIISSHPAFSACLDYSIEVSEVILPLELLSFSVKKINKKTTQLIWQTASEINTSHFEIERSNDGINWEYINEISAAVNSNENKNYHFSDIYGERLLATSKNHFYYRLRMVDTDGSFEYSPVRSILLENNKNSFSIFPNPVSNNIYIKSDKEINGEVEVYFMDNVGRKISEQKKYFMENEIYEMKNMAGASDGLYFILIKKNGEVIWREKMMKK